LFVVVFLFVFLHSLVCVCVCVCVYVCVYTVMKLFITLFVNINKSRTRAIIISLFNMGTVEEVSRAREPRAVIVGPLRPDNKRSLLTSMNRCTCAHYPPEEGSSLSHSRTQSFSKLGHDDAIENDVQARIDVISKPQAIVDDEVTHVVAIFENIFTRFLYQAKGHRYGVTDQGRR
jgi:hypothetical protein